MKGQAGSTGNKSVSGTYPHKVRKGKSMIGGKGSRVAPRAGRMPKSRAPRKRM